MDINSEEKPSLNFIMEEKDINYSRNTIWFFWDEGLELAPELVKISYDNWRVMNPEYDVVLLTTENVEEKIGLNITSLFQSASARLGMAGKTDFLRLYLLYHWGGVWVDATTFCLKPLGQWLNVQAEAPFFCFVQPDSCPDRQLISWFISAQPKNPLIYHLLIDAYLYIFKERSQNIGISSISTADKNKYPELVSRTSTGKAYLQKEEERGVVPYFWLFYLFNEVVKTPGLEKHLSIDSYLSRRYSQPSAKFSDFIQSYVSKQTYRVSLSDFRERLNFLEEKNMISEVGMNLIECSRFSS
ncbi:capsular polysaccharide synthesis protein [Marinobacter sp. M1N3S26]|uniref:capsular polysaccharide synthesis protein n=1 Tax=Marinobacter sp. M1N3S26 TaxID=3382299 RepID=UPI00387B5AC7